MPKGERCRLERGLSIPVSHLNRFVTNLSALCAIALAVTVANDFAEFLRAHLLRYVCNSLSFRVKLVSSLDWK